MVLSIKCVMLVYGLIALPKNSQDLAVTSLLVDAQLWMQALRLVVYYPLTSSIGLSQLSCLSFSAWWGAPVAILVVAHLLCKTSIKIGSNSWVILRFVSCN